MFYHTTYFSICTSLILSYEICIISIRNVLTEVNRIISSLFLRRTQDDVHTHIYSNTHPYLHTRARALISVTFLKNKATFNCFPRSNYIMQTVNTSVLFLFFVLYISETTFFCMLLRYLVDCYFLTGLSFGLAARQQICETTYL